MDNKSNIYKSKPEFIKEGFDQFSVQTFKEESAQVQARKMNIYPDYLGSHTVYIKDPDTDEIVVTFTPNNQPGFTVEVDKQYLIGLQDPGEDTSTTRYAGEHTITFSDSENNTGLYYFSNDDAWSWSIVDGTRFYQHKLKLEFQVMETGYDEHAEEGGGSSTYGILFYIEDYDYVLRDNLNTLPIEQINQDIYQYFQQNDRTTTYIELYKDGSSLCAKLKRKSDDQEITPTLIGDDLYNAVAEQTRNLIVVFTGSRENVSIYQDVILLLAEDSLYQELGANTTAIAEFWV